MVHIRTHELTRNDVRFVVERLPRDIRKLLSDYPRKLMLGGGFIRAVVAGEEPHDIDLFGCDAEWLEKVASQLLAMRPGARQHKSKNAITIIETGRMPIQFITRWTFSDPKLCMKSFDFTVCQAVLWRAGTSSNDQWLSAVSDGFYIDLAGRRLVYTMPVRDEEPGGSMLRVIKYLKRGYTIQVDSLANVIERLVANGADNGVIYNRLREVDPSLVVDGLEIVHDHEQPIEGVMP